MKGIAHFACGVAAASCFPEALTSAANGNPVYMLAGGVCGILPDTLDFKIVRYLCRHDMEIAPDPQNPDPYIVADALKTAIERTEASGVDTCVKLHTVRLAQDRWVSYTVAFDNKKREIQVHFTDEVDSGGNVILSVGAVKRAKVKCGSDVFCEYGGLVRVGFLEGPTLLFKREGNRIKGVLIHWHRMWSHSLLFAAVTGAAGLCLADGTMGCVCVVAILLHVIADQAGFMGGSLLYPLSARRISGLRLMRSGDSGWNFAAVWACCILILWNAAGGAIDSSGLLHYAFWWAFVPVMIALRCLKDDRS